MVPLSTVYSTAAKSEAELAEKQRSAPQPQAGTSADMRLFRLRPLSDEKSEVAREVASVPGSVPLFYSPDLFLTVEGEQRRPYFFRLRDLETTWARRPGAPSTLQRQSQHRGPRLLGRPRVLATPIGRGLISEKRLRRKEPRLQNDG